MLEWQKQFLFLLRCIVRHLYFYHSIRSQPWNFTDADVSLYVVVPCGQHECCTDSVVLSWLANRQGSTSTRTSTLRPRVVIAMIPSTSKCGSMGSRVSIRSWTPSFSLSDLWIISPPSCRDSVSSFVVYVGCCYLIPGVVVVSVLPHLRLYRLLSLYAVIVIADCPDMCFASGVHVSSL